MQHVKKWKKRAYIKIIIIKVHSKLSTAFSTVGFLFANLKVQNSPLVSYLDVDLNLTVWWMLKLDWEAVFLSIPFCDHGLVSVEPTNPTNEKALFPGRWLCKDSWSRTQEMTTPISNLDGGRRAFCPRLNRHVGAPTRGGGDPHNSEAHLGDQSPQRAARGKDDGSHEIFPPCYVALEASLRRRYPGPHAVSLETSIHPLILFSVPSYNPFLSASTDVDDEEISLTARRTTEL